MKLIAGLDIGNGYVKGAVNGNGLSKIDIPSGVAGVLVSTDIKPSLGEADEIFEDFYNHMDASFESPLIKDNMRRFFGKKGLNSGYSLQEFDVYSPVGKAQQELSAILTLGCLAGKVVQDYWNENHKLPVEVLKADVRVALALPIGEYKKYRSAYADGYKSSNHIVTFHNFEQPMTVELHFEDVQVIAEGASAQYAINSKGEELMEAMLSDVRKMGATLEGITAKDVLSAMNTVGVDIGEGTVNFPVFQNGKFNPDVSLTFDKGYGSVMNRTLDRLQDKGIPFQSRKALVDFLQTQPTNISRPKYNKVSAIVKEEITVFVNEIVMQFSKVMNRVGQQIEVIYIYGGGATPVRDSLYPAILEKAKVYGGGEVLLPILYLDSRYSRYLNREGLYVVADKVAKAEPAKKTK